MSIESLLSQFTGAIDKIFAIQDRKSALNHVDIKDPYTKYKKLIERSQPSDHQEFFQNSFKKNREAILKDENDFWLKNNNVFIQFNEGSPKENQSYRIKLSQIYKIAVQERKDLLTLPDCNPVNYPEIQHPEFLLLNYYKVIHYFLENSLDGTPEKEDAKSLAIIIMKFELNLGLRELPKEVAEAISQSTNGKSSGKEEEPTEPSGEDDANMNNFFDAAGETIKSIDIDGILNNLKGNKKVSSFIGKVANKVKGRGVSKKEDLAKFLAGDGMGLLAEAFTTFSSDDISNIIPPGMMNGNGQRKTKTPKQKAPKSEPKVETKVETPEVTPQVSEPKQEPKSLIDFDDLEICSTDVCIVASDNKSEESIKKQ